MVAFNELHFPESPCCRINKMIHVGCLLLNIYIISGDIFFKLCIILLCVKGCPKAHSNPRQFGDNSFSAQPKPITSKLNMPDRAVCGLAVFHFNLETYSVAYHIFLHTCIQPTCFKIHRISSLIFDYIFALSLHSLSQIHYL